MALYEDLYSEPTPVQHQHITGGRLKQIHTSKAAAPMAVPIAKPAKVGPETSWSFFHPGRVDVRFAPDDFRKRVKAMDDKLEVAWHPVHERWCVWVKNPHIKHWMCPGWQLLFPVKHSDGTFCPLDERVLAEIVNRSPRKHGNGRQYFERVMAEIDKDRKAKRTAHQDVIGQHARDRWDFAQIKVSMAGKSSGSKFTNHHAGD